MYFLYGGCHGHPPALLCSRCRRQYCSPANAWGIARPPIRRARKPQKSKPTSTATTTSPPRTSSAATRATNHSNNNNVSKSQGTLERTGGGRSTSRPSSSHGPVTGSQNKPGAHSVITKEPVKCGKTFAEKLRGLLSCVA